MARRLKQTSQADRSTPSAACSSEIHFGILCKDAILSFTLVSPLPVRLSVGKFSQNHTTSVVGSVGKIRNAIQLDNIDEATTVADGS